MGAYTQLPDTPFNQIAFNAGVIAKAFNIETGALNRSDILFATTGGSNFNPNLEFLDLFEDVDNAKPGTKQGMIIKSREPHLTTNALTVGKGNVSQFSPNSDITTDANGVTKITPKDGVIKQTSYFDVWIITDYATMITDDGTQSGFFAIHMKDCLNISGIQPTTTNDGKVQFALDLRSFYDAESINDVPYEIYFKGVTKETTSGG